MGIGSIFKNMFGGGNAEQGEPVMTVAASEEYNGFLIEATPMEEAGQFRTAGTISREVDGIKKSVRFIRADNSTDREHSANHALAKGRQLIDEQGERLLERELV